MTKERSSFVLQEKINRGDTAELVMTKKVASFLGKNRSDTLSYRPGYDTNPSDASGGRQLARTLPTTSGITGVGVIPGAVTQGVTHKR